MGARGWCLGWGTVLGAGVVLARPAEAAALGAGLPPPQPAGVARLAVDPGVPGEGVWRLALTAAVHPL